jgi:hypothetical protein
MASSCELAVLVLTHSSQRIYSALISQDLGMDSAKPPISQMVYFDRCRISSPGIPG